MKKRLRRRFMKSRPFPTGFFARWRPPRRQKTAKKKLQKPRHALRKDSAPKGNPEPDSVPPEPALNLPKALACDSILCDLAYRSSSIIAPGVSVPAPPFSE